MKILTGRFKGKAIEFKPEPGLRPTPDKVRKAMIDAFAGWTEGRRVLDLYSGTGAFGLELLSAGAAAVDFVERDPVRARRIQDWLSKSGIQGVCRVWVGDVARMIQKVSDEAGPFDLVVLDPPYDDPTAREVVGRLENLVKPGGFLVYECRSYNKPPTLLNLEMIRDKTYGDTRLVIYKKKEN